MRNLSERICSWLQVERKHYMHKFKCKLYHRVLIPRARRNVNESCLGGMCVCLCYHTETSGTRTRFAQCSSSTKVTISSMRTTTTSRRLGIDSARKAHTHSISGGACALRLRQVRLNWRANAVKVCLCLLLGTIRTSLLENVGVSLSMTCNDQ